MTAMATRRQRKLSPTDREELVAKIRRLESEVESNKFRAVARSMGVPRRPDASTHSPDPRYLRRLLAIAGLTQAQAAAQVGISERAMRYHLSMDPASRIDCPYAVQFALEVLADCA